MEIIRTTLVILITLIFTTIVFLVVFPAVVIVGSGTIFLLIFSYLIDRVTLPGVNK